MKTSPRPFPTRATVVAVLFVVVATFTVSFLDRPVSEPRSQFLSADPVELDEQVPPHIEPSPPAPPPPSPVTPPSPRPKAQTRPRPAAAPITGDLSAYRGLGAWVDVYDYAIRDSMDPAAAVDEMARRGVRTLYLQTGRWKEANDIVNVEKVNIFLDRASAKNIRVVGWYLPGFGDIDRDIRRSLAVLNHVTPSGSRFSGLAPDIETREEVGGDRDRFNAGISEYSRRLREAAPNAVLAGIVVDAKNNERAPARWAGFPWQDIARYYDIVMPMAYWSVTKSNNCGAEMDVSSYMDEVVSKTEALMGQKKPLHIIGGIADCNTVSETAAYVTSMKRLGSVGGSLYDFATTQANPSREALWSELAGLNA